MLEQAISIGLFEARKWTSSQTASNRQLGKTIRRKTLKSEFSLKSVYNANKELQKRLKSKGKELFDKSLKTYNKTGKRDNKQEKRATALYRTAERTGIKRLGQKEKRHVLDDSPSNKSKMVDKRGRLKKFLDNVDKKAIQRYA